MNRNYAMSFFQEDMKEKSFKEYFGEDPGWGTEARRALFRAACKYLDIDPYRVENIFMVGVHSMLQSNSIYLTGSSLDKVKSDAAFLSGQQEVITEIKNKSSYKIEDDQGKGNFYIQLGGQRAKGEMWKQALEFWKWHNEYSATWEMAFNELTWTVRSVEIKYDYKVNVKGDIAFRYWFTDILDLRPSWGHRSTEYNAICTVLGFLYHDVLGGSDELEIKAHWTNNIKA